LILVLIFLYTCSFGQLKNFQNKRQIMGNMETWNRIIIPDEMYSKLRNDLNDLRIIGFTKEDDTIEAPYLLEELSEKVTQNRISFKIINSSNQGDQYFYTFEVPSSDVVNEIILAFEESNFDRNIKLEGSNQQTEWFTILDETRILSVNNKFTNYSFTTLNFHDSKYHYYRISFKSNSVPKLTSATISEAKTIGGIYRNYDFLNMKIEQNKKTHETIITGELPATVPVSYVKINVSDSFDFYRPFTIQYLTDSTESQKGTIYNYSTIVYNTFSSIESAEFRFPNTFMRKMKIVIANNDNEPLTIKNIEVKGYSYQLVVRMVKPANYFLFYNHPVAQRPIYDLLSFKDKIPHEMANLSLGPEEASDKAIDKAVKPLFENKIWLWTIMLIIILILGGFTYKMLKK
jgi:hypothetical protein